MTRAWAIRLLALFAAIGLTVTVATADEGATTFSASLSGFNEVPPILTNGSGSLHVSVKGNTLTYTETFSNLTSPVLQSHFHFAQRGVNGGVYLFICSNLGNGPAGTPACPAGGGTVTRTVTAADIVGGAAAQNLAAGDFAGAIRAIRAGDSYVNVHTKNFPAGEIRGQVHFGDD
jgi:CHRD domain